MRGLALIYGSVTSGPMSQFPLHLSGPPFSLGSIIELGPGERLEMIQMPDVVEATGMESPEAWQ